MGTDIHIVIEKKWRGQWVGVRTGQGYNRTGFNAGEPTAGSWVSPAVGQRNYGFFSRLAGVRREGPEPRGVPPDASALAEMLINEYGVDGHSHSWLPLREFAMRWCASDEDFLSKLAADRLQGSDDHLIQLLDRASIGAFGGYSGDNSDDYRVVFWFDN